MLRPENTVLSVATVALTSSMNASCGPTFWPFQQQNDIVPLFHITLVLNTIEALLRNRKTL